jgi:hypothetical protein
MRHVRASLALILLLLGVVGCAGAEPFDYAFNNDPRGPGLFTGEAGAFVLAVPERSPRASAAEPTALQQ